jgi:ABC-2 type transport system ATP-binding protein
MSSFAIRTMQLSRDFGPVHAVDSINLEVPTGSVFGFLGPNGAGKTTTIRLLLGLLEPSGGQGQVLNYDLSSQADLIRQHCGALLEYNGLYERMTAEDNLEFYGRVWQMSSAERRMRIQEMLKHLSLWDRRKELVRDWSRGMKQKLAVARALFHHPALIFLDEPTAGLDPLAASALREDLDTLAKQEGVTIFLTTHNLAEAEKLCDQVGVIRQGKLLAVGTVDSLRSSNGSHKVVITGSGFGEPVLAVLRSQPEVNSVSRTDGRLIIDLNQDRSTASFVSLLVNSGAQVEEVVKSKASLEDVFLTLMEEDREVEK